MKAKRDKTDEMRIKASKFDEIMRRALGTPPLQEEKPKAAAKKAKKAAPKK